MLIGEKVGKLLAPGDLLNLNGELGAGKTLFVKGVALALGLSTDEVTSPTFSIINEYQGAEIELYHFDLYRLEDELELEQVGYQDYFYGAGITVVEWGELFTDHLPDERLDIALGHIDPTERTLTFIGQGQRGKEIEEELRGLFSVRSRH
ncbi:MAG: tRNA (adenosine(37)-N6)-threonylcarbamoyltransferase complex ATPase subunit type 1 TsaE [Firmicutes bacterium]|nr:tRNA (adenosine(37)-N6)-threonylcarbamoyltransferase complex ATPase subunit type 1 TsaE [Bacillota bacterium]